MIRTATLAALVLVLVGCGGGEGIEDRVADRVGEKVVCGDVVLTLAMAGADRDIYACDRESGESAGCFAIVKGELFDATELVRALDKVHNEEPAC